MKVIILGKTGMLGSMVEKVLSADKSLSVLGTQFNEPGAPGYFDVMKGIDSLGRVVDELGGVDYFVNCIGITANLMKDTSPKMMTLATRVNALFPQELAMFAADRSARVLHMSTDGVFGLDASDATEDQTHDCLDAYGKTKSLGEADAPNVINIRTSIIGPSPIVGGGLFEWFRSQPDGSSINGFTDHMWRGVTTKQFAEFCHKIIADDLFDQFRSEGPAVHFVPNKALSKFEMLEVFRDVLKKDITINPIECASGSAVRTLASTSKLMRTVYPIEEDFGQATQQLHA